MIKRRKLPKLPVKQLIILSICRFAEPIALSSVFPYLPEMIESFNVPKEDVSKWAGITSAAFSLSQALTGIAWGRASDRFGRKPVILAGMICVMSSSILFGFSRSLVWAIVARSLAGASNGNVGTMRTAVAEMVPQKELQPRAFSCLPLVWTIGSIFGPGFGGALANPAAKYPKMFHNNTFLKKFPFALPNLVASAFFLVGLATGILFLKETLETKKHRRDYGRALGKRLLRPFEAWKQKHSHEDEQSASLLTPSHVSSTLIIDSEDSSQEPRKQKPLTPPAYREVFSYQSNVNLLTYTLLALHSIAYDQLLPIFMHYPPQSNRRSNPNVHLPFKFTGGFGIDSDRIGLLFTLYGVVGMFIQFFIFPPLARHFGILRCLKGVSMMFPLIYILTPFTALFSTKMTQQIAIFVIMLFKCWAIIFAFPCTTILLTNSAASLRVLGTLNGVAVSISALGRAAGPAIGGWTFTIGLDIGYGIVPWWTLAALSALGALPVWWLVEMDGFGGTSDRDSEEEEEEEEEEETLFAEEAGPGARSQPTSIHDSNISPGRLYKTVSHNSNRSHHGPPLRRMSSPLGMRDSVGPGGGRKLSNGLGQSNSGYGTGGSSYQ